MTNRRICGFCGHFRNDPAYLESAIKGLSSFGSGWASVGDDDGICLRHDRYLGAHASCEDFNARMNVEELSADADNR